MCWSRPGQHAQSCLCSSCGCLGGGLASWAALVGVLSAGVALSLRRALSLQRAVDTVPGGIASGVASILLVGPLLHLISRLPLG